MKTILASLALAFAATAASSAYAETVVVKKHPAVHKKVVVKHGGGAVHKKVIVKKKEVD